LGFTQSPIFLSWSLIKKLSLSIFSVVLAAILNNNRPGSPWRVIIHIDEWAEEVKHHVLADVF